MTDWEDLYQRGETGWDKGAPAPGLLAFLETHPLTGRVLVPGCGRGHDVYALAEAGAREVVGLDLAPSAVAQARQHPKACYVVGDLFALPESLQGVFDAVFEHTCFCAIPRVRRDDYARSVAQALTPGGLLLALFYLNPRDNSDPTLGPPFGVTVVELEAHFTPHFTIVRAEPPAATYPGREGREVLWLLQKPL